MCPEGSLKNTYREIYGKHNEHFTNFIAIILLSSSSERCTIYSNVIGATSAVWQNLTRVYAGTRARRNIWSVDDCQRAHSTWRISSFSCAFNLMNSSAEILGCMWLNFCMWLQNTLTILSLMSCRSTLSFGWSFAAQTLQQSPSRDFVWPTLNMNYWPIDGP